MNVIYFYILMYSSFGERMQDRFWIEWRQKFSEFYLFWTLSWM